MQIIANTLFKTTNFKWGSLLGKGLNNPDHVWNESSKRTVTTDRCFFDQCTFT